MSIIWLCCPGISRSGRAVEQIVPDTKCARLIEPDRERLEGPPMLRQISNSLRSTKASPDIARVLRRVSASAAALALLASSALADNYKLLDWDWKFQKYPMASSFEYCSTNAPRDPTDATKPWSKVLNTIRTAADKWKYSKKDAKKDTTIFQFRFSSEDCPQCPGLNYIEFGTLNDPKKPAETSYPNVSGTAKMKKCAVRFNSAMSSTMTPSQLNTIC
jgi:hypothetical protein